MNTTLYRKRFIPMETILLKDDNIVFQNEDVIVTKWNALKPREDFSKGISCYFLKEGYKISRFINKNDNIVYHYCDIIETEYIVQNNTYIFIDLLADVLIYENGFIKVVDIAEIAEALEKNILSLDLAKKALYRLDALLTIIYNGTWKQKTELYFEMGLKK
ncbi:MAG: DUF402 domain-containing protein [Firmicutes bacterium]|jgi:predicted RNA-binding protein associated with RNAse of E/G family|nr:DUF402 domain-containing protein [Bacillota bacterium]